MQIVKLSEVSWIDKPEAGVTVGRSPWLPSNTQADIVYAELAPGRTLYRHYHVRPLSEGYIACFLFRGGHVALLETNGVSAEHKFDEPVHLTFFDREVHGIRNLSHEPLIFEVVCAPRFREGEEIHVDPPE
jgi:hypothetical protein